MTSPGIPVVIIRRTKKLARSLPVTGDAAITGSNTALGDWYVNRLVVDRRPLLLLLSSRGLLPILLPAREVSKLPSQLRIIVGARLRRLGISPRVVAAETAVMEPVYVAATADRSVVGIMVDFAKAIPCYLEPGKWDESTLPFLEARLAETPCHAGTRHVVFPDRAAPELLCERWGAG